MLGEKWVHESQGWILLSSLSSSTLHNILGRQAWHLAEMSWVMGVTGLGTVYINSLLPPSPPSGWVSEEAPTLRPQTCKWISPLVILVVFTQHGAVMIWDSSSLYYIPITTKSNYHTLGAQIYTHLFPHSLEVQSVLLSWNQSVSGATVPPEVLVQTLVSSLFQLLQQHSLYLWLMAPSSSTSTARRKSTYFSRHISFFFSRSLISLCFPLIKTLVATRPSNPGYLWISRSLNYSNIAKFLLPYKMAFTNLRTDSYYHSQPSVLEIF